METPRPRITGTEMEYPIGLLRDGEDAVSAISSGELSQVLEDKPLELKDIDGFLSNGARLYLETAGSRAEYATAEDISFTGTFANEIAGEEIVWTMLEAAKAEGLFKHYELHKRVLGTGVDKTKQFSDITWGYHENYAIDTEEQLSKSGAFNAENLALLGMHLATRTIYCGAGGVRTTPGPNGGYFSLGQKVVTVQEDVNGATIDNKPLVNTRNEPHAERFGRMPVVSGDAHMSPWAARMQLGTTSLVLRLGENRQYMPHLRMAPGRIYELAHHVAADETLRAPHTLKDGESMTAVDIQYQLLEAAQNLAKDTDLSDEELFTLREWERALRDAADDPEKLKDRADWAGKQALIGRRLDKYGDGQDGLAIARQADWDWDSLDPARSIGLAMRRRAWQQWMPDDTLVETRKTSAPAETRARTRAAFVAEYAGREAVAAVWSMLTFPDKQVHKLNNPYDTTGYDTARGQAA